VNGGATIFDDQETVEFLRDHPHLLAIADAVRATQSNRTRSALRRTPLLVAAVVACALLLVGVAIGGGSLFHFSPRVGELPAIGQTRSEVITSLESRLPLVSKAEVFDETVPAEPDNSSEHAHAVSGLAVKYDLSVPAIRGADIGQALWEGDLFTGALRDEFAARGLGDVIDAYGTFVTPDGSRESAGGGVSYGVATNQVFNPIPTGIVSTVAKRGATVGLHSVQVKTMHVLQDALVIHATSNSPKTDVAALLAKGGLTFLLGQNPSNFEGVFLRIDDSSGNPVYDASTAPRAGGGGFWADPALGLGDYSPHR
jgi:hypothetical protein